MPKKILLADDSVTIQKVVELTFSEGDYSVTSVSNGRLAVEQLTKERPDIVIVDIIMPEMSGYDVAEYIKKNPQFSAIPVVLLTGTFEPFDEERAKKTGAEAYVTKPFDSKMLVEKVESLLAQKVKVEDVGKIPPATIFQSRQEYEIPGVVSDHYIEQMKAEEQQEFPQVEEFKREEQVSSSITADFIPSVDEIQPPPIEESPAEATAISSEHLPPSDFEGFEAIAEPPLPTFEEPPSSTEVSQETFNQEIPAAEKEFPEEKQFGETFEKEAEQEYYSKEEVSIAQPEIETSTASFEEQSPISQPASFEEGVIEIPTPHDQESLEKEFKEEAPSATAEEEFAKSELEREMPETFAQENVVEIGEEHEAPFFESAPSFAESPTIPEAPEIVTDLSEQVMMVAEGQQKAEEIKEEISKESPTAEESFKEEEPLSEQFVSQTEGAVAEEREIVSEEVEKIDKEVVSSVESAFKDRELKETKTESIEVSPEMVEGIVRKVVEEMAPSIIK
ncbi:MAG: response regulator, partial [Acidobacteria bacterium]|nr:response regulator [Acidobacteriota bacterium]